MQNQGTEDTPNYVQVDHTGVVMIITMSKPELEDRLLAVETDIINTMLELTEIYEGSVV